MAENGRDKRAEQDREDRRPEELVLPPSILPRSGEHVVWYTDAMQHEGLLVGHGPKGIPVVQNSLGFTQRLASYDLLRLKDPSRREAPNWMRLPERARIKTPFPHEVAEFDRILNQHIPPGPTYMALLHEIWNRGFEVFLVGGTVRDILSGGKTNDVDVVTTMPLGRAMGLLQAMYRKEPTIHHQNGFVRLGGTPASGDPFIDLKSFVLTAPGTEDAIFAGGFTEDLRFRDFACNSIYYDPINRVLIDPSGLGITHAETQLLHLVCDSRMVPAFSLAQITIRFFKFRCRGFSFSEETGEIIRQSYLPTLGSMKRSTLIQYVRTQLLSKSPAGEHSAQLQRLETTMREFGADEQWEHQIAPVVPDILPEGSQ